VNFRYPQAIVWGDETGTGATVATLYIVATPIGNLADLTYRAGETLRNVDALACEDTRRTLALLDKYEIPRPGIVFSNHEHNEDRGAQRILGLLNDERSVAICSNAGYPGISDPGYRAIQLAAEEGHRVEVIPGASAVPVALLMSALPTSSYTFRGFPPRKQGRCRTFLAQDAELPHTQIFYESPFRIGKFLALALEVLGDRRAAVCLELTKLHERVNRGWLSELVPEFADRKVKGEAVIVIAGNHPKYRQGDEDEDDEGDE
jgi:16S rRNA (cytidine1402-2'-O)-methyltransferase